MDPAELRAAFTVFERRTYLNAGTCWPLPAAVKRAADAPPHQATQGGGFGEHVEATMAARSALRAACAVILHAETDDVALTTSTSEGLVRVLLGLDLRAGDEVLTAPDEHPGLLAPLAA